MNHADQSSWRNASGAVWTGRVMSGLFVLFILTGLLGGSVATQLRVENPLFSHSLFTGR